MSRSEQPPFRPLFYRPARGAALLLLLLLLSLCWHQDADAQRPTAVVKASADVDGDGRADELRIDHLGSITVQITGKPKQGAWTPLAATGKIIGGTLEVTRDLDPSGKSIILAKVVLRSSRTHQKHEEAVVLAYEPGRLLPLWRGAIGSTGRDSALFTSLEIGKYGLIKYSSRHGVLRCDGKTAHLDATRFDFKTGAFRTVRQAVRIDPKAPLLRAQATAPEGLSADTKGFWFRAQAASSSLRAASAAELVAPLSISDNNDKTAWVESKGGFGRGEFVTLKTTLGEVQITALRLVLGHGAARKDFNRPKRLGLLLGRAKQYWIEIPKDPVGAVWVALPVPTRANCVSLVIDDVYPGASSKANRGRTAISEVDVLSVEELNPTDSARLLADRIAQGKAGADINRLLQGLGAAAAPALLSSIASAPSQKAKTRLRLALARIPAGPSELVLGLIDDSLAAADHLHFSKAIASMDKEAVPALAAGLQSATTSDGGSQRITGLLAALSAVEARDVLIEALGRGSARRRNNIVRALGSRPDALESIKTALARAPLKEEREADLYRAIGIAGAKMELGQASELAQIMASRLSTGPKLNYEAHYRLLESAGLVGGKVLSAALLAQVVALKEGDSVQEQALLRVALSAMAALPPVAGEPTLARSVSRALEDGLSSRDPGVRLAVLRHLDDSATMVAAVTALLREDAWPEVRLAAAANLASSCATVPSESLGTAVRADSDAKVAGTALAGLLRCQPAGLFQLLLDLLDDAKRPLDLRLQAGRSIGGVKNARKKDAKTKEAAILRRFQRARRAALSRGSSGQLASALTVSLVQLGSPEAIDALERSASDPAFPQLQAASVSALGQLCPKTSQRLIRTLRKSRERSVSIAARMASERCR